MSVIPVADDPGDDTIQIFFYLAIGVETIEIGLNFYLFSVYVFVVAKKATLHQNLRFLLILLPACHMVFFLTRLSTNFFVLMGMEDQRRVGQRAADLASSIFYGFSVVLASERLVAACFGMNYEENAINLALPVACSLLMSFVATYTCVMTWNQYWNYFHIYSILGSFVIYSTVVSLLLPYIANKQQKTTLKKRFSGHTTLAGRILVEENVRTAEALQIMLPFIGISSILLLLAFISVRTVTKRNFPDWFLVYGQFTIAIYYCLHASQTMISMLLLLFYHKSLRTKLALNFPIFVKVSQKLAKVRAEAKQMAFQGFKLSKEEEKEAYFDSYKKQWQ